MIIFIPILIVVNFTPKSQLTLNCIIQTLQEFFEFAKHKLKTFFALSFANILSSHLNNLRKIPPIFLFSLFGEISSFLFSTLHLGSEVDFGKLTDSTVLRGSLLTHKNLTCSGWSNASPDNTHWDVNCCLGWLLNSHIIVKHSNCSLSANLDSPVSLSDITRSCTLCTEWRKKQ